MTHVWIYIHFTQGTQPFNNSSSLLNKHPGIFHWSLTQKSIVPWWRLSSDAGPLSKLTKHSSLCKVKKLRNTEIKSLAFPQEKISFFFLFLEFLVAESLFTRPLKQLILTSRGIQARSFHSGKRKALNGIKVFRVGTIYINIGWFSEIPGERLCRQ